MSDRVAGERQVFGRIFAGTDGSARAEVAVAEAVRLASVSGAPLEALFVIDAGRPHDRPVDPIAEAALGKVRARASDRGVEVETRIVAGDPATRLMEEAARKGADVLCVGPDAGLISDPPRIGRVASRVLREAPCSVLVARAGGDDFPSRIVCGIDGSEESAELAAFAVSLAAAAGAELALVHVEPLLRRSAPRSVRRWLAAPGFDRVRNEAEAEGVSLTTRTVRGHPPRRLIKLTNRSRSDLLVVGHRGVQGVRRALLGSVSERCARDAACSVLVSRPAPGA